MPIVHSSASRFESAWRGRALVAVSVLLLVSACAPAGDSASDSAGETDHSQHLSQKGTTGAAMDPAKDASAFIAQLWLIEGHLLAGSQLYAAGEKEMAATHMKHPEDELYAALRPAFEVYGASGLETELQQIAGDVADGAAIESVTSDFETLRRAIAAAAAQAKPDLSDELRAAAETLRVAAYEFDEGVKDGSVVNIHEYQDAHGFTATVVARLTALHSSNPAQGAAITSALEIAREAASVAPTVLPPARIKGNSGMLIAAAQRLESLAASF